MKIINKQLLDETSERAKQSPRLRMNYNFHEQLAPWESHAIYF